MFDLEKLKKIELVVFDVDGTLVNDEGEIGDRTRQLIIRSKKMRCAYFHLHPGDCILHYYL